MGQLAETISGAALELTKIVEAGRSATRSAVIDDQSLRLYAVQIFEERRLRSDFLDRRLFAEPGWDMLVDLYIADSEAKVLATGALCVGSGIALTTGLRWLSVLERSGYVERAASSNDRRCQEVRLTEAGRSAIRQYLTTMLRRRQS